MMHDLQDQKGIALVITLLVMVLITAMVVEFSYAVYVGTHSLYNWRDSQRLSLMAKSGVHVSAKFLGDYLAGKSYTHPGFLEFPVENPFEDFRGDLTVRIEDEWSKFNLNCLINDAGGLNAEAYQTFSRLLEVLGLEVTIADKVIDWIDRNREGRWEADAKNSRLDSVDELLAIPGLSVKDYNRLRPYVTVYGATDSMRININGAEKPVIMSLSNDITDSMAQRVIDYRKNSPFIMQSDLSRVKGFEADIGIPPGSVVVRGENFSIRSTASSDGLTRVVETAFDPQKKTCVYWKEY
jgi:general secretion pathway protein K